MKTFYEKAIDSLGWQEITLWYRRGSFNHYEEGHSKADRPKPKTDAHKISWSCGGWTKRIWYGSKTIPMRVLE